MENIKELLKCAFIKEYTDPVDQWVSASVIGSVSGLIIITMLTIIGL